jgi:hypothetical protein
LLAAVAGVVVGISLCATLVWIALTTASRPLDGVEGEVLFEADRLRSGLPLYVDPAVGAHEYGAVPARYLVLYPPVWSALLSVVPRGAAAVVGRAVATIAWLYPLAWILRSAPRERARARAIVAGGAFVLGAYTLAMYGASARPDALAVAASALAVERASRLGRVDAVAGALFALAAWVKPNVIGAAPGAFVAAAMVAHGDARARARAVLPGALGAALVSVTVGGALTASVSTAWVLHLFGSTGQEPSLAWWLSQLASRGPFFALPIAAALAIGWRARRDAGAAIAAAALATSAAWCVVSLAKIGSASNYFMEPLYAAVVVLARADVPLEALVPRGRIVAAGVALVQAAWVGVASVRSALEGVPRAHAQAEALASARATCGAGPAGVIVADEPGLELTLDGRIVATPFQSTHLARRGRFPLDAWIEDVRRPEVRCVVMQDDLLERPLERVDVDHDRFGPELRRVLVAETEKVGERAGFILYRRRAAPAVREGDP